jgi:DNA-binding GntR family transcriptional regulator
MDEFEYTACVPAQDATTNGGAESHICGAVRTAILQRRLAPGTRLPEAELGRHFAVSRTIVRQALRTLAHEGIVALRDRRVAVVTRPSAIDVAHTFAARRAIESSIVVHVCEAATRAELAALRKLVREEEGAYRRGDREAGLTRSLDFHRRLGALCRNPVLERYLGELVLVTSLAVALYEEPGSVHAHADHAALADAIAHRDGKRAARLMNDHLQKLESGLRAGVQRATPSLDDVFGGA